jgi:hypothetical protein
VVFQRTCRGAVAALLVFSAGCLFDTSNDVAFMPADTDIPSDAGNPNGTDVDGGEVPDLSSGPVCDGAPRPAGTPSCSPVSLDGCRIGQFCDVVVTSPGPPPTFELECRLEGLDHRRGGIAGDDCSDNSEGPDYAPCQPGHRCIRGTCYRYCRLEDGAGCADGQSCQPWFPTDQITHFGLCVGECGNLALPGG